MSTKYPTIAVISIMLCLALIAVVNEISTMAQETNITIRASVASDGSQGNDGSESPSISADGRYVAFESYASNLVDNDTNGDLDVFVYDQLTEQTIRVSANSDGSQGNGDSQSPVISADGRYVAFVSHSSNLVSNDTNGCEDVFVHDRQTGQTARVSVASGGSQANDRSFYPAISADGRYIAFTSHASNLVSGDTNNYSDVFVRDRRTGVTIRISIAIPGLQENGNSLRPSISADGRYIAFESNASTLVSGDTNGCADIFFHDQLTGQITRISITSGGAQGNGSSREPSISAYGRYVAFWSEANNLVSDDTNGQYDTFVHDQQTGQTERVSIASDGTQGNGGTSSVEISGGGRYVVFTSFSSNLVSGDTNARADVFVHDRQTRETKRVSVASDGTQGNMRSGIASISAGGRYVAFESLASNLVGDDTNSVQDIFVHGEEFLATLSVAKETSPDPVDADAQLTYTLHITNTGSVDLHTTVTDTLPAHVTPTGILTWTPTITAPGGIWTAQYAVTVEMGYAGPLTNVVEVTTAEGATGVYTATSEAQVVPALSVTKRASPGLVLPGDPLTYTLAVTNTGNVTLTATITDILPVNVTVGESSGGSIILPPGWIVWSPVTLAPADVWTKTVVVTVTMGAAGLLTNTVQVVTEEGASGTDTVIVVVEGAIAGLAARNDSPTQLGDPTTLTATVTAGSHVTYLWNFGDGEMGSDDVVSHTYPNVGTYTAVVTASNSLNVMTATSSVTITAVPVAGLTAINDSPTSLGRSTTLTAAIAAGSNVTYAWAFGDGEVGYGEVTAHSYPACGTYTAVVTASNSANALTATTQVKVMAYVYLPLILKRWPPVPYPPTLYPINNADGGGNYTVNWTEQLTRLADIYTLEEATNATFTADLRNVCTTAQQSCAVSGKSEGIYYYRVRGHNKWGYGPWSNIQSSVVSPPTATPTLTPSPTFTPTPTPTPTSTPTPTPTPLPQGVYILPNYSYYTSGSTLHIVGEVHNNTSNYVYLVKVPVNLFNSGGQLVDTDYTYTTLDLPAGKKSCFRLMISDPPDDWAYFQFESLSYYSSANDPWPSLTFYDHYDSHLPDGSYKILGWVRNDDSRHIESVEVEGTLYNASGIVVGCGYTWPSNSDLDPGQTSSFELNYSSYYRDYSDVISYRLQADGYTS